MVSFGEDLPERGSLLPLSQSIAQRPHGGGANPQVPRRGVYQIRPLRRLLRRIHPQLQSETHALPPGVQPALRRLSDDRGRQDAAS